MRRAATTARVLVVTAHPAVDYAADVVVAGVAPTLPIAAEVARDAMLRTYSQIGVADFVSALQSHGDALVSAQRWAGMKALKVYDFMLIWSMERLTHHLEKLGVAVAPGELFPHSAFRWVERDSQGDLAHE